MLKPDFLASLLATSSLFKESLIVVISSTSFSLLLIKFFVDLDASFPISAHLSTSSYNLFFGILKLL